MAGPSAAVQLQALLAAQRGGEPFVVYRDGGGVQQIRVLAGDVQSVTIGRSSASHVPLGWDADVSRLHALLERVGGVWTVADDGLSRNGTFLNGQQVSGRRRLADGDRLRCGRVELVFRDPAEDSRAATVVDLELPFLRLSAIQRRVLVELLRPSGQRGSGARPATNAEIAEALQLSVASVKAHLRVLCARFGVDDLPQNEKRARLAELALSGGPPEPGTGRPSPG